MCQVKALLVPAGEGLSSIEATAAVNAAIGAWEQQQAEHHAAAEALLSPQQKARIAATKSSGAAKAAPPAVAKPAAPTAAAAATSPKGGSGGDSVRVPFAGVQYFQAAAKVPLIASHRITTKQFSFVHVCLFEHLFVSNLISFLFCAPPE
jgi:hypothetical protein